MLFLGGGFREEVLRKTNIYREGLPKRGGLGQFKGGRALTRTRGGGGFEGEGG